MHCARCQHENRPQAKFCEECGTPLTGANPRGATEVSYAEISHALSEVREQHAATAEILRAIASSPTNLGPTFATILDRAMALVGAQLGVLWRYEGDEVFRAVEVRGASPESMTLWQQPQRIGRPFFRTNGPWKPSQILDVRETEPYRRRDPLWVSNVEQEGVRTLLAVPLVSETRYVGAIALWRQEVRAFTEKEIALLQTFADQAVIAIENVRLFNETKEALEQQTATAEILRVISSSPTDLGPVMEAVAENAARVCGATYASIFRLEGEHLRLVAQRGSPRQGYLAIDDILPVSRDTIAGRAVRDRRTIHVEDILAAGSEFPATVSRTRQAGAYTRTVLATPLLREGTPLGLIFIIRGPEPHPFSAAQIALLETFAAQAVIAIENVRLFTELQQKNRALTEAHAQVTESLEQQTATSEILQVISRSPTDAQPVFEIIAQRARRLCDAQVSVISRLDGEQLQLAAVDGVTEEGRQAARVAFPQGRDDETVTGRTLRSGAIVHASDVFADAGYRTKDFARTAGFRGALGVPLIHSGHITGVIFVAREAPGLFTDAQVELLKTFADQAVIAVENVRLFTELQARTRDLIRSVGELKALGEVSQAVSSTLDLQTVLTTIVGRAVQLSGTGGGVIYEYDEAAQQFQVRATDQIEPEHFAALRATPIRLGQGAVGQAAATRMFVQVPDILAEGALAAKHIRPILARSGYRSILAVPLLFEQRVMGGLVVWRREVGPFDPGVVNLLQTFATQSVLAIQNARLFREIEDKSQQLEAASRHKSEFLANMSHELRTPLNAILGFSEVLAERMFGEVNEKQAEYLQDILSSGRHLLSLINDILDLSKVEAGRLELELGRFHLPTALDNALTLVRERASRHGIILTQTVDEAVGHIVADERKVKQILLNLLSNAVKFTPEKGRVDLTATAVEGVITISVSDTGIGIAPEDQAMVFEEFRQVGQDGARKQEGTGLGLTLTKKFVELHGGRIWVQSEVGQGSTFTFTVPVGSEHKGSSGETKG
jgi:signal transduction histidine kinase